MSDDIVNPVVNLDDVPVHEAIDGDHWGGTYKVLTPTMRERGGRLGMVQNRLLPGRAGCPFHSHRHEDEVFFIQSGRGVLRYGDQVIDLKPGDCISCPAGTGIAHQICNPYDEDLIYLGIGDRHPDEICEYPDSNKVMVRSLGTVGILEKTEYMHGEPECPLPLRPKAD